MLRALRLKLKQRWLPRIYGRVANFFLKIIAMTCKFRIDGLETFLESGSNQRCILMTWHNRLAMIAAIVTRFTPDFHYAAMISNSRDGEVIAALTNSYRRGRAIRISHHAKSAALQTMIRELKKGKEILIITPDGPRGPLYEVKPGIIVAAREADACIIPLSWSASRSWQLWTWDGLLIPKPFSTIDVKFGAPISLPKGGEAEIGKEAKQLRQTLIDLT
jgi:lysophospholipid acyltransferase (LPLAT)-like uncharacterized protein